MSGFFCKDIRTTTEITEDDGSHYLGEVNSDGKKHGYGIYTFLNGLMRYSGQWENNYMSGNGSMWWHDGHRYTGGWKNSKRSGYGVMIWSNGIKYKGLLFSQLLSIKSFN